MTEIKKYNENDSQNQENFSNNLSVKDLKNEIIVSLKDEKISPLEAKRLKELFGEINNINSEARKAWNELSIDIRKNFQKKLGSVEDGKIGKETLTKLENITNIRINLENPETKKLSENLGETVSNTRNSLNQIGIQLDNNLPQKITAETDSNGNLNIFNKTTTVPKTVTTSEAQVGNAINNFNSMSEKQKYNVKRGIEENLSKFKILGYNIKSISISTQNDNIPPITKRELKNVNGDDQGNSYGFDSRIELEKGGNLYIIKGDISAYTNGTEITYGKNLKAFEDSGKDFLDVGNLQILKSVYNKENERGDFLNINIGGGLQARGLAPKLMKNIQSSWHELTDSYNNTSSYNGEKGFSVLSSAEITGKKYLVGDKEGGIYIGANLDSTFSLDNKGVSSINTEGYVGANYKKVNLQAGMGYGTTFGGQSDVLKFGNGSSQYVYGKMNIPLGKNVSTFVEVKKTSFSTDTSINDRTMGRAGIEFKF